MIRIIAGRGTGKTLKLMELAKEHNGVIVCANPYAMKQKAQSYGITGFDIISYKDYFTNDYQTQNCFIDEIEMMFHYMTNNNLTGYTLSLE